MIKVIFAGTGTPGVERVDKVTACASEAILIGEDILLFDCGRWVSSQLLRSGVPPRKVNYLFFTHIFHFDHTCDYPNLLFSRYPCRQLDVFGPQGTLEFTDNLLEALIDARARSIREFLSVRDVDEGMVHKARGWEVTCVRTKHGTSFGGISLAYKVSAEGKSVVISGDVTVPPHGHGEYRFDVDNAYASNEKLLDLAREANLFIMDADLTHTTPVDMARAAKNANVKTVVLTHIHAEGAIAKRRQDKIRQMSYNELIGEMKKIFNGEIIVAEDLESLTL